MTRFVVAKRLTTRGAGLGNEMIPWAKGFIASQALNAHLVGPSWGLNQRRYYRNFGTSRFDFVSEAILRSLPVNAFTEDDYYSTGIVDYGAAIRSWAQNKRFSEKSHFVVTVGGMYGGYLAIASARSFLRSRLLNSRNALSNIFKVQSKLDRNKLLIAVHLRLAGDFSAAQHGKDIRSQFNIKIPIQWYLGICESLRKQFASQVEFCFFTDKETPEYLELVSRYNPNQVRCRELSECSDLLLMASADLRVCSVSSYSLAACYLSEGPYVWYEPQLHIDTGSYSLWGHEPRQKESGSPTMASSEHIGSSKGAELSFRGYPSGTDCSLPDSLIERLHVALADKDPRTDLARYGCYPL